MRDYGKVFSRIWESDRQSSMWTDYSGKQWPVVRSTRRLKFKNPSHAALRAHVHRRDGYCCVRCGVLASYVPPNYDGRMALVTTARTKDGWPVLLVLDHVLTLKAGGLNEASNLQSLCETCNLKKMPEDAAATRKARSD